MESPDIKTQQALALPQRALIALVRCYQLLLSPLLGQRCRFYPSCSNYFIEAVNEQGIIRGSWLGIKRLLCCHPWHPGGLDPVPRHSNCHHQHHR